MCCYYGTIWYSTQIIIKNIGHSNIAMEGINCHYLLWLDHQTLNTESIHKVLDLSRNINSYARNKIWGINNLKMT